MTKQITHIRKLNANSTHEHITQVKGINPIGLEFVETVAQVITALKSGTTYFVHVDSYRVNVDHQKSASGDEYIKTKADSTGKDNLLSLPKF